MNILKMEIGAKGIKLRGKVFGEYMEYLKQAGIDPDFFDRHTWMDKVWDYFYRRYMDDENLIASRVINRMSPKDLRDIADSKETAENASKDK